MTPLEVLISNYPLLGQIEGHIAGALDGLEQTFRRGGRLLTCGNGGSASDADHIAGELLKGFALPRPLTTQEREGLPKEIGDGLQRSLPVIPLGGFAAFNSAFCNDCSADLVFAQLVWGLGSPGDALLAISTSGNSTNVCAAAQVARAKRMKVIALTGRTGGKLAELADHAIIVPEKETYRIQEFHLPIYHALCLSLETRFFG
jgi:D-sedoheptulose 7-phosphate isomerase